ncbi:VOC family protein [Pseudomonas corrugata]|uniref:VOC family protein n=1 Tax=Pseudomonas corrugata TaxID=47879 RepID=UPI0006D89C50|nr:VOC family protein [Pseudomonas corrugata]
MGIRGNDRQIDNIEFNVNDIGRSKAFYGSVFGWRFVDYGPTYTEFSDGRLEGTQLRLKAAGATISREVFAFPGGQRFHFIDPDGYELAVWSAS